MRLTFNHEITSFCRKKPAFYFFYRKGRKEIFVSTERENLWGRRKDLDWSCFSFQSEGNLWKSRMGETLNWRFSQYNNSTKKILVKANKIGTSWQKKTDTLLATDGCLSFLCPIYPHWFHVLHPASKYLSLSSLSSSGQTKFAFTADEWPQN